MQNFYDFVVIGAGISACTFASSLNRRFSNASILLVEQGRRLGGRATMRKSRKNKILAFNHGLPSISFSKHISQEILQLISPLINSKKLVDISKEILLMNEFGVLKKFSNESFTYRSLPFISSFCEEIIDQAINPEKINFLFQTLVKSIQRINGSWEIEAKNGRLIKSYNLILSSSLIAHPRCLKILKIKSIPLRDAFIYGNDKIVDAVLQATNKLTYLKRKNYILHVFNFEVVKNFNHEYLQICFSNVIRDDFNYEKIIFQRQSDGSMIVVLHCFYTNHLIANNLDNIIQSLISLFGNYKIFVDLFLHSRIIDLMYWRASQPLNHLLPKELQWSSSSKIGFCGDWFDLNRGGGVESAMNSSIRLSKLLN